MTLAVSDTRRSHYLAARGIVIVRFSTDLVFRDIDWVLSVIAAALGIDVPSPARL